MGEGLRFLLCSLNANLCDDAAKLFHASFDLLARVYQIKFRCFDKCLKDLLASVQNLGNFSVLEIRRHCMGGHFSTDAAYAD